MVMIPLKAMLIVTLLGAGLLMAEPAKQNAEIAGLFKNKCAECHGPEAQGNSLLKTPSLASQSRIYIAEQLKKFKAGLRGESSKKDAVAHLMSQQAKGLTDKQINQLAIYLSTLKAPIIKLGDKESALRGKLVYHKKANCTSCHGLYAEGNDTMKAPKLNILSAKYIESSFKKFARGQRAGSSKDPMGQLMVKVINDYSLTENDFKDLSNYISGLRKKPIKE